MRKKKEKFKLPDAIPVITLNDGSIAKRDLIIKEHHNNRKGYMIQTRPSYEGVIQFNNITFNKVVIAITGVKGSGKSTVADIIAYILNKGIANSSYDDFLNLKDKRIQLSRRVTNFADPLKKSINNIFGITLDNMYTEEGKEYRAYVPSTGRLIDISEMANDQSYFIKDGKDISLPLIVDVNYLHKYGIVNYDKTTKRPIIFKIRTLMQYHGDMMKELYGNNIWANRTKLVIQNIVDEYGYCLVGDVRYENEIKACRIKDAKRVIIHIDRPSVNKLTNIEHSSEIDELEYDIELKNDSSMMVLYFRIVEMLKDLLEDLRIKNKSIYDR